MIFAMTTVLPKRQ